jgi:tRNA G18 (ribose-2'-O)-methylase SpoU
MVRVTPADEEDFEIFDSLRERRIPPGHFVGDGLRVVRRMLDRGAVVRILCTEDWAGRLEAPDGVEVRVGPRERLHRLVGFRLHQGIMALGRIPPAPPVRGDLHVALDGLSNAENVGAVMRTCAAFGVDGVFVPPTTASPWLRRAIRVSMGAPLHVPVHLVEDLPSALAGRNAWAAHIHGDRRDYREVDLRGPTCLVLGGEDKGITDAALAACRGAVTIPMSAGWDCLNVATSAAVLLAEVTRQRGEKETPPA